MRKRKGDKLSCRENGLGEESQKTQDQKKQSNKSNVLVTGGGTGTHGSKQLA